MEKKINFWRRKGKRFNTWKTTCRTCTNVFELKDDVGMFLCKVTIKTDANEVVKYIKLFTSILTLSKHKPFCRRWVYLFISVRFTHDWWRWIYFFVNVYKLYAVAWKLRIKTSQPAQEKFQNKLTRSLYLQKKGINKGNSVTVLMQI